ncbi:hypothetical protein QCA50_008159 [Cerrena zonata]|uniref:Uncharacterized protein n=1 Tax=Cerrena zonata TaxID=2478898 RepID=A0AAW0GGM2_9APHY
MLPLPKFQSYKTVKMADHQEHTHADAHPPILEDVNQDNINSACDHPVPPLPPNLAFSLSQLSTLTLSMGSQWTTTRMSSHHIATFLSSMPNLEHLVLRDMITRSSTRCTPQRTVRLPHLRSLHLFDGDQGITSLLHHLAITPNVKLDIEIVSLANIYALVDVFSNIRRILRGNNHHTYQTLESLGIVATPQGLVVKCYYDLVGFCSMQSPDSEAPIRISLEPVSNQAWTQATFAAIFGVLPLSSIKALVLGDLTLDNLTDPVLRIFLQCLTGLKYIRLVETQFDAPLETLTWGTMVLIELEEEPGLPILSYLLERTIGDLVYCEKLWRVLENCEDSGCGIWDVYIEQVRLHEDVNAV